jgi:DNA-binding IclR family transcriptional regulator
MDDVDIEATPKRGARRVLAVDHAIDVLEAISHAGRPVGVSAIARRTGLSKTSVHHLLATLETRRFVIREVGSATFRLGWNLYELGATVVRDVDISRVARPQLNWLSSQTGESTLLGILDGDSVLYLDRGEAPKGVHMIANAGRRSPLHASASGKVHLAFASDQGLIDHLTLPLTAYTTSTITDIEKLRGEIGEVRRRGYAVAIEEYEIGLASVSVPIRDYTDAVTGCLTLAGPVTRLTPSNIQAYLRPLRTAATRIEVLLGGSRPAVREAAWPLSSPPLKAPQGGPP